MVILPVENVMIAQYKVHVHVGKVLSPFQEPVVFKVSTAVKKVAHKDDGRRLEMLYLVPKTMKIFAVDFCGNRNTRTPEMACFTKMQI
jgi:hypothetical protein